MRVGVTGATGLIGRALCADLSEDGCELVVFSRSAERAQSKFPDAQCVQWDAQSPDLQTGAFEGLEVVVNLAGESIAEGRWTEERKRAIRASRVGGTRKIVQAISQCKQPPGVLVNGSAIGFYGNRGDEQLDEESSGGTGFLPDVCRAWEAEAKKAGEAGARVVLLRTGIVLSPEGGALAKMLTPFKMFAGGPLGDGSQWMSWIHLSDEVRLIRHAMEKDEVRGPLNATAPSPATNKEFSQTLGKVLGRPAFMPAPAFALKFLMGEMAEALLLEGQRVLPRKAENTGFQFQFTQLDAALRHLLD